MSEHHLKTWPSEYDAIARGEKTFEYRSEFDRDFAVGDVLRLRRFDPATGHFTGTFPDYDQMRVRVTHVLHGGRFDVPEGFCVMSIKPLDAV